MEVGDTVRYVGEDSMSLDIHYGDIGKIMATPQLDWQREDVSVYFLKWTRQGGSRHPPGCGTHHVNGIECFYIEVSGLEHAPVPCMFGDEHA